MSELFKDFIKRLCEAENLVDVAPQGIASQSSTSQWSKPNDAQQAVNDHNNDFAFHTNSEKNPWWEITLDDELVISYIIIENRRKSQFQIHANDIVVEAKNDKGDTTLVYRGKNNFGAFPDQVPLILPVKQAIRAKSIRISRSGNGYLHLSRVHVLVRKNDLRKKNTLQHTILLVDRTDGLGQRLLSMINAIALSDLDNKLSFQFKWPERNKSDSIGHAIINEKKMFSSKFLLDFSITESNMQTEISILDDEFKRSNDILGTLSKYESVLIGPDDFNNIIGNTPELDFKSAYNKISFSDKVESARSIANSLEIDENTVAIHNRAGDIIYGHFRYVDRFIGKVIPFPLTETLIRELKSQNNNIIIFGQDETLCRYLTNKFSLMFAGDIAQKMKLDEVQSAIFEITLMARCNKIYAGSSGFAQVASLISGVKLEDPRSIFPKDTIPQIVLQSLQECDTSVSDLQKAFALRYASFISKKHLTNEEIIHLIKEAIKLDPNNGFYKLVLSSYLFLVGKITEAEEVIINSGEGTGRGTYYSALTHKHPDKRMDASAYIPPFVSAAQAGSGYAAAALAIHFWAKGDITQAKAMLERAKASAANTHPFAQNILL